MNDTVIVCRLMDNNGKMNLAKYSLNSWLKIFFPPDIAATLSNSLKNPAASSCADEKLLRVLKNYDPVKDGHFMVEQLPPNSMFFIKGGRLFKKGDKIRKRFKCQEVATGKWFLFSPVYEVEVAGDGE
jgi:hypothetical protein